jgi:hypothetical protein
MRAPRPTVGAVSSEVIADVAEASKQVRFSVDGVRDGDVHYSSRIAPHFIFCSSPDRIKSP